MREGKEMELEEEREGGKKKEIERERWRERGSDKEYGERGREDSRRCWLVGA